MKAGANGPLCPAWSSADQGVCWKQRPLVPVLKVASHHTTLQHSSRSAALWPSAPPLQSPAWAVLQHCCSGTLSRC